MGDIPASIAPIRTIANRQVQAERMAALIIFLTTGIRYKHDITRYCDEQWGIGPRQAATLASRALSIIRSNRNPSDRAQQAADALARIDTRITRGMSDRDYVRAEELRANIVGYLAPKQVEVAQYHVTAGKTQAAVDWTALKQVACHAQGVALPAPGETAQLSIDVASVKASTDPNGPEVQSAPPMVPSKRIEADDVPELRSVPAYGEPILIEPPLPPKS